MMISDLVDVPAIRVVERAHLQDLLDELELQQSGAFDPATARKVGRLAGAQYVVLGSIVAMEPQIEIDTRVVRIETGEVMKATRVKGREKQIFDLQRRLANQLIEDLQIVLSPEERAALEARQRADGLEDVETALEFSRALSLFDRGDYLDASEKLVTLMRRAPESRVVRMLNEEARRRAASSGKQKARKMLRGLIKKGVG